MTAEEIELLLLDLDGTLLDPARQIRPATLEVLQTAMSRGYAVGLCSSRSPRAVRPFVDELQPNGPQILLSGCLLWDSARQAPIAGRALRRDRAVTLLEVALDHGVEVTATIGDDVYVRSRTELSRHDEHRDRAPHIEVDDLVTFVRDHAEDTTRLVCLHRSGDFTQLRDSLRAIDEECSLVRSAPTHLEILPADANKGTMLDELEHHYRINPRHILAFGDERDDVELLRRAGASVVMGNAPHVMRTLVPDAVFIGSHDTDAIATFLTKLLRF